jgi:hypothetical protein
MHSREKPSQDYKELLDEYKLLHTNGNDIVSGKDIFNGISLVYYLKDIEGIINQEYCRSILDYGCGKAWLYSEDKYKQIPIDKQGHLLPRPLPELWGLDYFSLYDPGYEKYNKLPKGKYDGVISSDVIEHIDEKDSDWVLNEIFSFARKFVFITIACYEALKKFSNGRNVHVNVKEPEFWKEKLNKLSKKYPYLNIYTALDVIKGNKGHWESIPYIIERKEKC